MIRLIAYLGYAFLALPIVCVIGASLTAGGYLSFPPQGLSLRWYHALLADQELIQGAWLSLVIAAVTTLLTTIIGTMAALYLARPDVRARNLKASLFLSPLSVPMVLTGFAMLVVFTRMNLVNVTGLIISHVVVTVPYMMRTAMASLSLRDPSLVRAAAILGANPWRAFWEVTFPLLRPGIVAGALFTFLASLNNVMTSIFISSPGASPLPVVIFNRMDNLAEPSVAAAATSVIIITAIVVLILERRFSLFGSLLGQRT